MYQIIINHWGLSLGEIETINNLFKIYVVIESEIQKNSSYASILEIEFIKNVSEEFFNCISIDRWNLFVDVIKNIRKRRGSKGLRFKLIITECFEQNQYGDEVIDKESSNFDTNDTEDEIELLFCRRMIYLLGNKNHNEFTKGVERIEISIENITELFNQTKKMDPSLTESQPNESPSKENKDNTGQVKNDMKHLHSESNIQLFVFVFDHNKRIWKTL